MLHFGHLYPVAAGHLYVYHDKTRLVAVGSLANHSGRPWADLGLTLPNTLRQGELTILIVLVILASATFFLFSAVRLWLAVTRPERENRRRTLLPEAMGPSRYVVPPKPIPVVLVGDEEAVGMESQAVKSRPPAYGLWRESVVSFTTLGV